MPKYAPSHDKIEKKNVLELTLCKNKWDSSEHHDVDKEIQLEVNNPNSLPAAKNIILKE